MTVTDEIYRRIAWRILPLLMMCYVLAYIDRTNIGIAKLDFTRTLGFSETVYGVGASVFYLGYILFEIPSNLYLARVGMRRTLLRIMILWGVSCAAMALMTLPWHYYGLRILLGIGEAGLAPGVFLYITFWIPAVRRARFTALFMASVPLSGMIGGPLAGLIMHDLDGALGLAGWQWLFVAEGLPVIPLAIMVYRTLDDRPGDAAWLTDGERRQVIAELTLDETVSRGRTHASFAAALKTPRFYLLVGLGFGIMASMGGLFFWLPTMLRETGVESTRTIGFLSAIPFAIAVVAQYLVARRSDLRQERRWHTAIPAFVGALGWGLLPIASESTSMSLVALTLAAAGTVAATGVFWTLPAMALSGTAAAGGIALVTTLSGLGNFISPTLVGWLVDRTGDLKAGQYYFGTTLLIGALMVLAAVRAEKPATHPRHARA